MTRPIDLVEPGSPLPFDAGMELMRSLHSERVADERRDALLLLEHTPVITLGKNASEGGVTATPVELAVRNIQVRRVERGGQATCHLPGQLVAYPILKLRERKLGVKSYVALLEEVMIGAAAALGVRAWRQEGVTGVWCGTGKLGAVGIAVKSGVTMHGIAFNVCCDLNFYRLIIPCGRADLAPSSLSEALGREVPVREARAALLYSFGAVFGEFRR